MTIHQKLDTLLNMGINSLVTYNITKAHLSNACTMTIPNLSPNKEYKLVLLRSNINSDPTALIQEGNISNYTNCSLEKIGYGLYKCIPTSSSITLTMASVNGGGYFYNFIGMVFM